MNNINNTPFYMRKKNSKAEFSSERSELLLKNFRESLARQSVISLKKAFQEAADFPAPRFWVTEARAMRVIMMMMKGEPILDSMNEEKRKMYEEIYERVTEMRKRNPETSLGDIVFEVVNSPAPRSYLSWHTVKNVLKK